ncbi:MAG: hypothetical protein ACR2G3_12630 [Solirubrobacterales bacterium]
MSWPTASWALKERGTTQLEVVETFRRAVRRHARLATLDDHILELLHPRPIWPVVSFLLEMGSASAGEIADRALWAYAETDVSANRVRGRGRPAQSSIDNMEMITLRLFDRIIELRKGRHPHPAFALWTERPTLTAPEIGRSGWEFLAPDLAEIRLARTGLVEAVHHALGVGPDADLLDEVRRASVTRLARGGPLFRTLRDLVAADLLVCTGCRPEALAQLMRSDFVADHVGVPPDNRGGYALLVRPRKGLPHDEIRIKVLSNGLGREVEAYRTLMERATPALHRWRRNGEGRTRYERAPDDFPLLVSDRVNFRPFGQHGLRRLLSGVKPDVHGRHCEPLIRRERGVNPELSEEQRRCIGHRPTEWRHASFQLGSRAGRMWSSEHPSDGADPLLEPQVYGHALLDHGEAKDPLKAVYGDHNLSAHFELIAGRATEGIWRLISTDDGLRDRPNLALCRELAVGYRALAGHIEHLRRVASERYADPGLKPPPKILRPELPTRASQNEKLDRLLASTDRLLEGQDVAFALHAELRAHLTGLLQLHDELARAAEKREEIVVEVSSLLYDETRWERIPDEEPPGADVVTEDLRSLLEGRPAGSGEREPPGAVRGWLLPSELPEIVDVNRSTAYRWTVGKNLPRDPERRPWEPDAIPIDRSLGPRFARILVDAVKPTFWPTPASRGRLAQALSEWPQIEGWVKAGKPTWRCKAPLTLPQPFAKRLESGARPTGSADAR